MQLNEWIRKNSRMFKALLGDRIKLMTHLTPDLPDARACPRKLSQLMLSLVETAKDGMPDGGELTLASGLGHSCMEGGVRAAGSCTNELTEDCVAGHVCRRSLVGSARCLASAKGIAINSVSADLRYRSHLHTRACGGTQSATTRAPRQPMRAPKSALSPWRNLHTISAVASRWIDFQPRAAPLRCI